MPLTELQCKNAKPTAKPYKLFDGKGLYLEVMPNGRKYWRLKYRHAGRETRMSFGPYGSAKDEVTLARARDAATAARGTLKHDKVNPITKRREERKEAVTRSLNTLQAVTRQWFEFKKLNISANHANDIWRRLEMDLLPFLGSRPIADITSVDIIEALQRVESRGAHELARRLKQITGEIFRFAITRQLIATNPATAFECRDVLRKYEKKHYASIDSKRIPEFLEALNNPMVRIFPETRMAMWLLMLTFVRPSELAEASWSEFDLEAKTWLIPAERMKMRRPHLVPLSEQAIKVLTQLRTITGHREHLFPNQQDPRRPMSNNTILKALAAMGFKGEMTGHGFRALAMSGIKERLGYSHEVVDLQLAHDKKDKLQRAYDRAQHIEKRTEMMQAWADFLEGKPRPTAKVIQGNFRKEVA